MKHGDSVVHQNSALVWDGFTVLVGQRVGDYSQYEDAILQTHRVRGRRDSKRLHVDQNIFVRQMVSAVRHGFPIGPFSVGVYGCGETRPVWRGRGRFFSRWNLDHLVCCQHVGRLDFKELQPPRCGLGSCAKSEGTQRFLIIRLGIYEPLVFQFRDFPASPLGLTDPRDIYATSETRNPLPIRRPSSAPQHA